MKNYKHFKVLWITDPWLSMGIEDETTARFMQESVQLGAKNYWCDYTHISLMNGQAHVEASFVSGSQNLLDPFHPQKDPLHHHDFIFSSKKSYSPNYFTHIFYRVDPPIDHHYYFPLQILSFSSSGKNPPRIFENPFNLFLKNEKFEGHFSNQKTLLFPESIITSNKEKLMEFGFKHKETVLKPLHLFQSKGIEKLLWKSKQDISTSTQKIKALTHNYKTPVILQTYLPGILKGETRLWFINGKLLACAQKIPKKGTFKIDMDRGGRVAKVSLSSTQKKIAQLIGRRLKKSKIMMAAVDLIDNKISDYNFTSPGLICEMEWLLNKNLSKKIIQTALSD